MHKTNFERTFGDRLNITPGTPEDAASETGVSPDVYYEGLSSDIDHDRESEVLAPNPNASDAAVTELGRQIEQKERRLPGSLGEHGFWDWQPLSVWKGAQIIREERAAARIAAKATGDNIRKPSLWEAIRRLHHERSE